MRHGRELRNISSNMLRVANPKQDSLLLQNQTQSYVIYCVTYAGGWLHSSKHGRCGAVLCSRQEGDIICGQNAPRRRRHRRRLGMTFRPLMMSELY